MGRNAAEKSDATPWLPGVEKWPHEPVLVELVKNSNPSFTGTVAVRDRERARGIVESLLIGHGVVATSRKFGCSTRTVHNVVKILRDRGELKSIGEHIVERLEEVITVGTEVWAEALEEGRMSPGHIPIPVLAAIDKRSQLQAGLVLGTGRTEKEIQAGDVEAAFRLMKPLTPGVDTQSTGSHPKPLNANASDDMDTALDTSEAAPGAEDPVLPTVPQRRGDPGGGGQSFAPPPLQGD